MINRNVFLSVLLSSVLLLAGCQGGWAMLGTETAEVPEGMRVPVTLDDRLDSGDSQVGEAFTMTVSRDVVVEDKTLIPAGSVVHGVVADAQSAGRPNKGGKLVLQAREMELRGVSIPIEANLTVLEGEGSIKEDLKKMGIGAGVGAAVGALIDGGTGALAGLAIGGGGTFLSTKGEQVELPRETPLIVELKSAVDVPIQS